MSRKKKKSSENPSEKKSLLAPILVIFFMTSLNAIVIQEILSTFLTAGSLFSRPTWFQFVERMGGTIQENPNQNLIANVPYLSIWIMIALFSVITWLAGGTRLSNKNSISFQKALSDWGISGWRWWGILVLWQVLSFLFLILDSLPLTTFLYASLPLWISLQGAAWISEYFQLSEPRKSQSEPQSDLSGSSGLSSAKICLLFSCAAYVVAFTWMNWGLYWELLLPHGDSAMYEEHLWNVTHGKGFRSYLDQGLFLGEHIQLIHLFLIPFHWLYPSQLTMELCESLALASGAIPVYLIARRHTSSETAGVFAAAGYLLYFPLQFLDIAIDFKTFRPIAFGVPVLLFALDQLERKRYKTMIILFLLSLTAKEDYAIVLAPIGLWIALFQFKKDDQLSRKKGIIFGIAIAVLSTVYLFVTVAVILPWFRSGVEIHYVGYFSQFGDSLGEVIRNILDPTQLIPALFNVTSVLYVAMILVPLGFLPLFSFSRFLTCLPLLMLLCLNEIAQDPRHHFHAPMIPILFWAACAGLPEFSRFCNRFFGINKQDTGSPVPVFPAVGARFLFLNSLFAGLFLSISPAGITFWDPGSPYYWRTNYVPGKRAEMFARIENLIPEESRVSSTDFVHPRYTHFERAYDYSNYKRAVNENQTGAPPDSDYIVIDTNHRYSEMKKPEDIPEYRDHPDEWELLPDETEGYFIVLKRKSSS